MMWRESTTYDLMETLTATLMESFVDLFGFPLPVFCFGYSDCDVLRDALFPDHA